jgi:hypothetical protein
MQLWTEAFIVIAAVAIVVQAGMMAAIYVSLRKTQVRLDSALSRFEQRVDPILVRVNAMIGESQERFSSILADAAEITHLARSQAQKVDRVMTDAADRMRMQLIRADQMLTGTLESLSESASLMRQGVGKPLSEVSALMKGIRAGLTFLRSRRSGDSSCIPQDEELFI